MNIDNSIEVRLRKSKRKRAIMQNLEGWAFLSLNFVGYVLFRLVPIIIAFILSFCDWKFSIGMKGLKFIGLKNYIDLWSDEWFIHSAINTFYFTFANVPIAIALSLIVAIVLNDKIFCRGLVRLSFYLPNISSAVAISIIWAMLFSPSYGPINMFLQSMGVVNPPGWISSSKWAMPTLILMSIWQIIGYNIIILLAGLQGISKTYYEAADIDGASGIQKFYRVTLPMLSPTIFFLTIMSLINSFQVFAPVNILTKGGPGTSTTVFAYYIYTSAFTYNKMGYASSVSWVLFLIIFAFTLIQWKLQDKWVVE